MTQREIQMPGDKSAICDMILRSLPDWFGIETSIVEYTEMVRSMPFCAAFEGDAPIGFVALKEHNADTCEVCVMGVLAEYHRMGVGRALISWCEETCRGRGRTFLTVKTLDESAESEEYARTRRFYYSMGFLPLEVFPLHWDAANPCLFMAKYLKSY